MYAQLTSPFFRLVCDSWNFMWLDSILSISADIETIGEILKKIIPTLEEVSVPTYSRLYAQMPHLEWVSLLKLIFPYCGALLNYVKNEIWLSIFAGRIAFVKESGWVRSSPQNLIWMAYHREEKIPLHGELWFGDFEYIVIYALNKVNFNFKYNIP